MNTIQQRGNRLYVVIQKGGLFEFYATGLNANLFEASYGNHVGEEVTPGEMANTWQSLDGKRRYALVVPPPALVPEFTIGTADDVVLTPEEEARVERDKQLHADMVANIQAREEAKVKIAEIETGLIPNKEVDVELAKEAPVDYSYSPTYPLDPTVTAPPLPVEVVEETPVTSRRPAKNG